MGSCLGLCFASVDLLGLGGLDPSFYSRAVTKDLFRDVELVLDPLMEFCLTDSLV